MLTLWFLLQFLLYYFQITIKFVFALYHSQITSTIYNWFNDNHYFVCFFIQYFVFTFWILMKLTHNYNRLLQLLFMVRINFSSVFVKQRHNKSKPLFSTDYVYDFLLSSSCFIECIKENQRTFTKLVILRVLKEIRFHY